MKSMEKVERPLTALAQVVFASAILFASANTALANKDHSIVVSEEKSLQQIVEDELQLAQYAKQIAAYNGFEAGTTILPIGTTLKIPEPYMQLRDFGTVVFAKGDVVHTQQTMVVNPPAKGAYFHQGDKFSTGKDGFVSLKFNAGSVINIQPESLVAVSDIACADEQASCVIAINTTQGSLESNVTPRPDGQPPIEFSVTTPFISAAVRGTSFYVNVDKDADRIGVTSGLVATEAAGTINDLPKGKGLLAEAGAEPALVDLLEPPELMQSGDETTPVIYSAEDTLRWKAMETAQQYRLTIAEDEAFTRLVLLEDVPGSNASSSLGLAAGEYYMSVAGIDSEKFLGLSSTGQFAIAEILDQQKLELSVSRSDGVLKIEPIEYNGTVELLIIDDFDNPTYQQRVTTTLSEGLSVEMDMEQDWIVRARKILSPAAVSVYSDYYFLEAEK